MVFADPPYNVPIQGHVSGLGQAHQSPKPLKAENGQNLEKAGGAIPTELIQSGNG